MTPNPLLKKLGYSDTDQLAIIHTDDIGMCHAALAASSPRCCHAPRQKD